MDTQQIPFRLTAARFTQAVRNFVNSEVGWKAKLIGVGLVVLLCGANGLNVVNSYVGRNFMTAIADRNQPEFVRQALFYVGVFAAATVVAVIARFAEERLGLLWREFLTRQAVAFYLMRGTYYYLGASSELANTDQRIAEDIRVFTVTTLSFVLMMLNGTFTILAFSGVLWSISPALFAVAVLYAAFGSLVTLLLSHPLIRLNYNNLTKRRASAPASFMFRQTLNQSCWRAARGSRWCGCSIDWMSWSPIFDRLPPSIATWDSSPRDTIG
jgi:putative ATP-binding cassette transporter